MFELKLVKKSKNLSLAWFNGQAELEFNIKLLNLKSNTSTSSSPFDWTSGPNSQLGYPQE